MVTDSQMHTFLRWASIVVGLTMVAGTLLSLSYEPEAPKEQPESRAAPGDQEEADERLEAQADAARTGDDRGGTS
jgi:hypothetical protein